MLNIIRNIKILLINILVLKAVVLLRAQQEYLDNVIRTAKSGEILKYMNVSADPCRDFYEFTCGNWYKHNPLSASEKRDELRITPESILSKKINADLNHVLREDVTLEDSTAESRVKVVYKKCLTAARNGQEQQAFFSEFINANGGFSAVPGAVWHEESYKWPDIVAQLRYNYGMDILIGVEVDVNRVNKGYVQPVNNIYLKEPSTALPKYLCNADITTAAGIDTIYEHLQQEISENLKLWLSLADTKVARKLAHEILQFETDLCLGISPLKDDATVFSMNISSYTRTSQHELASKFNNVMDFNAFITSSFGTQIYQQIIMTSEQYFTQLFDTVKKYGKKTTANYIMYRALSILSLPQSDDPNRRMDHCIALMKRYFPKILGNMYYRKYVNRALKDDVINMYDKVRNAFAHSLHNTWMDEGTALVGLKKIQDLTLTFPVYDKTQMQLNYLQMNSTTDFWRILQQMMAEVQPQQRDRLLSTDQRIVPKDEVESFDFHVKYRHLQRNIDFGWALLQKPFYDNLFGNAMHYAMIGHKLGTALAQALDDLNWSSHNALYPNWDIETEKNYKNLTECFRSQISNYLFNNGVTYANTTQLRTLIASSAGLNSAFAAYLDWLLYKNPNNDFLILSKETLPELNFTNTQLFFIAFGQMFCGTEQATTSMTTTTTILSSHYKHNMERYVVNGALQNSIEFAREFHCKIGAEMSPDEKCIIY